MRKFLIATPLCAGGGKDARREHRRHRRQRARGARPGGRGPRNDRRAPDDAESQNPCCGCVGHWSRSPLCRKKVASEFDRMVMPKCWVEVFERHGFHWLGHDELGDTMHFEFLGDPERILE